jgi:hypothetical protein
MGSPSSWTSHRATSSGITVATSTIENQSGACDPRTLPCVAMQASGSRHREAEKALLWSVFGYPRRNWVSLTPRSATKKTRFCGSFS